MAKNLLLVHSNTVSVASLTDPRVREACEQLHTTIGNDFGQLKVFRSQNRNAKLAASSKAYICPGTNTFHVPIVNVTQMGTVHLDELRAKFPGGSIGFVEGEGWSISYPLPSDAAGWVWHLFSRFAQSVLAFAFLMIAWAVAKPDHARAALAALLSAFHL